MLHRRRVPTTAALGWLSLLAALAGCPSPPAQSHDKPAAGAGQRAVQVPTERLAPASIQRHYRTSGTLTARREADIVATAVGVIRSIAVQEGDRVREDQRLARLDGRALALQATAAQREAENLRRELQRLESARGGVIPLEEIDQQRYAVEQAVAAAALSHEQARQTVVRAPFAGTVVARYVDEGALANAATPLFRIADLSALELELHLPERDAALVRDDAPVTVTLVDDSTFTATIVRRAPVVDPQTGTVKLTVSATDLPAAAKPGAFARAEVLVDQREAAPSLPRSAVFEAEDAWHVYVVEGGRAHRRTVEVGLQGAERVEIVDGLTPEDVVVRDGSSGITEGMPLTPATEEP